MMIVIMLMASMQIVEHLQIYIGDLGFSAGIVVDLTLLEFVSDQVSWCRSFAFLNTELHRTLFEGSSNFAHCPVLWSLPRLRQLYHPPTCRCLFGMLNLRPSQSLRPAVRGDLCAVGKGFTLSHGCAHFLRTCCLRIKANQCLLNMLNGGATGRTLHA